MDIQTRVDKVYNDLRLGELRDIRNSRSEPQTLRTIWQTSRKNRRLISREAAIRFLTTKYINDGAL